MILVILSILIAIMGGKWFFEGLEALRTEEEPRDGAGALAAIVGGAFLVLGILGLIYALVSP